MALLAVLVVDDPANVDEVVRVWIKAGVSGLTMLDSTGWAEKIEKLGLRDDLPLFPSARMLLRGQERTNRTIFSVVDDSFDLERLISLTEEVLGPLEDPDTGILLVVPVARVVGLQPRSA